MTTTARSDIHRPSAAEFDPQLYDLVFVRDFKPFDGTDGTLPAQREWERARISTLQAQGYQFAAHVGQAHQCGHCGTALRYAALLKREDAHELIHVGETCLGGRFELTKPEFDRLRKQSQLDREQQRLLTAFNALCERFPALAYASYAANVRTALQTEALTLGFTAELNGQDYADYDDWARAQQNASSRTTTAALRYAGLEFHFSVLPDIAHKARQYGNLSEKQAALIEKLTSEMDAKWAAFVARESAPKPETDPAPTGRVQVEGLVIKEDWREGYMGGEVLKISVKLDNGSIVWGSAPSNLLSAPRPSYLIETPYSEGEEGLRGKRIRFTATFEAKPDDPSFAFYKRPVKAEVIASE